MANKKVTSIAKCGCEIEHKDISKKYYTSDTGRKVNRIICPEHGEEIVNRKTSCIKCGESFLFGTRGAISENCPKCKKKKDNKSCKKSHRRQRFVEAHYSDPRAMKMPVKATSEFNALVKGVNYIPLPGLIKTHRDMFA